MKATLTVTCRFESLTSHQHNIVSRYLNGYTKTDDNVYTLTVELSFDDYNDLSEQASEYTSFVLSTYEPFSTFKQDMASFGLKFEKALFVLAIHQE